MSLPPGFLEELRNRTSIVDVIARKVTWDQRKSNAAKGDMWAPCPFHNEKTASFHVDDKKGFYHCFGCQASGDAITFLREADNMGFMEAVEQLARDAGMEMPARDPAAQEKAKVSAQLSDIVEMAVQFFRLNLNRGAGAAARRYLEEARVLDRDAQARWDIGFAPEGWQNLWDHLRAKNVSAERIIEAGLAKPSDRGGNPYDVFRNRIIFPIRDPRGRAIAFGGRAMDPADQAKYLNSPETPLFDKGRTLFNHGPARTAAGKGGTLLVAEGYMDVIALSEAGFEATVAPLGTAITEHQLALLWRISPEPVIALDGDKAGLRAAMRVIDLALPRLEAGRSLRFCLMPEDKDPDDLLKSDGPAAMARLVDTALPLSALLWRRETEGQNIDSPERRAALDRRLRKLLTEIPDPDVRNHYGSEFRRLRSELFGSSKSQRRFRPRAEASTAPTAGTKSSLLAATDAGVKLREAVILAIFLNHPALLAEMGDALERLPLAEPDHRRIADALIACAEADCDVLEAVSEKVGSAVLERLRGTSHVRLVTELHVGTDSERARACLTEEFAKLEGERALRDEVAEAEADPDPAHGDNIKWRIAQAAEAKQSAMRALAEDRAEYVVGPNGAPLNKDERDALRDLLNKISRS